MSFDYARIFNAPLETLDGVTPLPQASVASFSFSPQQAVDATTAFREALNQGISSGNLIDTKIILYSHRDFSGRICRPKALYANGQVLKAVPYFKDLLFGDFSESQSRDFEDPIDEEEHAEDYAYRSDSDLEDDEDERVFSSNYTAESEVHPFDPFATSSRVKTAFEEYHEHVGKGKVVKIPDMAFITFQAFLMYLYTDKITFAPFGSEGNRRSRSIEKMDPSDDKVPRPSPKSIYRLADKYDFRALKRRALDQIRDELKNCDIVEESFSRFASQYGEIRDLYMKQLASLWTEGPAIGMIRSSVEKKIKSFAKGDLEHAMELLSELWGVANSDVNVNPPNTIAESFRFESTKKVACPSSVVNLDVAFIRSIRKGVFFDRKYWVRHSKAGLKPIYLSSAILNDNVRLLNKVVRYVKGTKPPIADLEGEVNIESDCDGEPPQTEAELPSTSTEGMEEETCAVLITGSFAAWKSLFFYCCTDVILFAPLTSQGVDSRLDYIRKNTRAAAPPPCSPKSVYVLASLLQIQPLRDLALADIRSKITLDNVVSEVFSWVTAGQQEIMEMQCDLLVSKFKDPRTIASVKEKIRHISDGSSSHRAGALQLGFEKAFEFRAKKPQPSVKLVCSRNYCSRRGIQVPYLSLSNNTCPGCKSHMECANCRQVRAGNYLSCTNCGMKFV